MTLSQRNPDLCDIHTHSDWPTCLTCHAPADRRVRLDLLRTHIRIRSNDRCEWPTCSAFGAHMAHLEHRGMGGRTSADHPRNVAWLCVHHHDTLDGRTDLGTLRWELNELLRLTITTKRRSP